MIKYVQDEFTTFARSLVVKPTCNTPEFSTAYMKPEPEMTRGNLGVALVLFEIELVRV